MQQKIDTKKLTQKLKSWQPFSNHDIETYVQDFIQDFGYKLSQEKLAIFVQKLKDKSSSEETIAKQIADDAQSINSQEPDYSFGFREDNQSFLVNKTVSTNQNNPIINLGQNAEKQQLNKSATKLILTIYSKDVFQQLNTLSQDSKSKFIKGFVEHIKKSLQMGLIEKKNLGPAFKEFEFIPVVRKSGGSDGDSKPLLNDQFTLKMLPSFIQVKWENLEAIFHENQEHEVEIKQGDQKAILQQSDEDKIRQEIFIKMVKYFAGISFQQITQQKLAEAIKVCKEKFFGIQEFLDDLGKQLRQFLSVVYPTPKGVLFYGPPGTGKSAISSTFCRAAGLTFVAQPMAAGDFQQGIVGDSEKMLNNIAERAKLIPWETCCILIDEIDTLAPDRTNPDNKQKNDSLLGVILALMDGEKSAPNLKIFASTNLRENMDEAFLRRMEIQMFVGNPGPEARKMWIPLKAEPSIKNKQPNYQVIQKEFLEKPEFTQKLVDYTINYSSDAMRKVLERFYHSITIGDLIKDRMTTEHVMLECLRFTSKEMRVYLGKDLVVDILQQYNSEQFQFISDVVLREKKMEKDIIYQQTRRYLVDLGGNEFEQIQIEYKPEITEEYRQTSLQSQHLAKQLQNIQKPISEKLLKELKQQYFFLIISNQQCTHIENNHIDHKKVQEFEKIRKEMIFKGGAENVYNPVLQKFVLTKELIENYITSLQKHLSSKSHIVCYQVYPDIDQVQLLWLPMIVNIALKLNAECVKLIDQNFFIQNYVFDDNQATRNIINIINQMKNYKRSVIIFDLDSISGLHKNYSSQNEELQNAHKDALKGCQFSYQTSRSQALETCLNAGRTLTLNDNLWIFYICKDRKMVHELKQSLNYQESPHEEQFRLEEAAKDEPERCQRCLKEFTDRENELQNQCGKHSSQDLYFVDDYEEVQEQFDKANQDQKKGQRSLKKKDIIRQLRAKNRLLQQTQAFQRCQLDNISFNQFKYICCDGDLFSQGEIPCKHIRMNQQMLKQIQFLEYDEDY